MRRLGTNIPARSVEENTITVSSGSKQEQAIRAPARPFSQIIEAVQLESWIGALLYAV